MERAGRAKALNYFEAFRHDWKAGAFQSGEFLPQAGSECSQI